jgi:protein O-mannosyl-transferase
MATAKKKTVADKAPIPPGGNQRIFFVFGLIVFITFCVFLPAIKSSFTNWDDNAYVFQNTFLSQPFGNAVIYFFGPHYFVGNYTPVTMTAYALVYQVAELQPEAYHLLNVLLHLLNVALVFWLIYLLSDRKTSVAAFVSLFFGIHPMHVESVAWVAELKDVLYSSFFLAGLICYFRYIQMEYGCFATKAGGLPLTGTHKNTKKIYMLTLSCYLLSVLSKPAAVVFPLVLLLLDFYGRRKFNARTWMEKLPFFAISIVAGFVTIWSQRADHLLHDYYTFPQRLLFASHSLLSYIVRLFVPAGLSNFYPFPKLMDGRLPYSYYIAPVIVMLLCYWVYRTLKQGRLVAFGFLCFIVNIVLVLQLLSVGDAVMADRYTYIPYIGLLFVIGMYAHRVYHALKPEHSTYKIAIVATGLALAAICSGLSYARCQVWKNGVTLADDLIEKYPDDRLALNNKGFILLETGKNRESIEFFRRAVQVKPDYTMASINLINAYLSLGDIDNADTTANRALKYAPNDVALFNKKAYILYSQHKYAEAIRYCMRAIGEKKDDIDGYLYMSECYHMLHDYEAWLKTIETAMRYEPDSYILLNNKGYALMTAHRYEEAAECFKAALGKKPDFKTASINLTNCYKAMGN